MADRYDEQRGRDRGWSQQRGYDRSRDAHREEVREHPRFETREGEWRERADERERRYSDQRLYEQLGGSSPDERRSGDYSRVDTGGRRYERGTTGPAGIGTQGYGATSVQGTGDGGQREGGYGNTGRFSGRGPRNYQRSDERIREDINERLTDSPDVDATDLDVIVENAVVTLVGSVDDRWQKRAAEDIAENVRGVRDVRNDIRLPGGIKRRIEDAFGASDAERMR